MKQKRKKNNRKRLNSVKKTGSVRVGFFMVDIYPADWVKFLSLPAKSEIWKLRSFCNILRGKKTFQNF